MAALPGSPLTQSDLAQLAACGIDAETAERALLRRVDSLTGGEMFGRNGGGDHAGVLFPYTDLEDAERIIEYTLRLDHPPLEQSRDGQLKPTRKYLWPSGRGNRLYVPPNPCRDLLRNADIPVLFCEGIKKALALWGLAWHELPDTAEFPHWIPIALSGVSNFRGTVGKAEAADGTRVDVKGVITDFARIYWNGRKVQILFDSNTHTNNNVRIARYTLAKELRERGAHVFFIDMPVDAGVNGVDDLVGLWGKDRVLEYLKTAVYDPKKQKPEEPSQICDIRDLPSVSTMPEELIDFLIAEHFAYSTVNMLTGEPGCGKSTMALKLCYCTSTGTPFAGFDVKLGFALYIDCEQSRPIIQEKFRRLGIADGDRFKYWGPWAGTPPALNSPVLLRYVAECDPKPLIICDSYVGLHPGDENSSTETRAYIDQARQLANLGACVIFLHHTGKAESAKNYRGSSDIPADLDTAYLLSNLGSDGRLGKIRLQNFKARFTVLLDSILEYVDGDFRSESRPEAVSRTVTEQLIELLKRHPGIKAKEFEQRAAALNLGWSRARSFLKDGIASGRIDRERGPNNQQFHTWIGGENDAD
jgi:AAA domain/Domain of unknown function (DUF3854)